MADHGAVSTQQIDIADCSESSKLQCINATRMDDNETGKQPSEIKPKKVSPNQSPKKRHYVQPTGTKTNSLMLKPTKVSNRVTTPR
jgi:hypothetical protein